MRAALTLEAQLRLQQFVNLVRQAIEVHTAGHRLHCAVRLLWLICLLVLAVACAGKILSGSLSVRWMGESWRESLSLGVLMNTRGLVDLIVLNIGLDLGVLSPTLFAMLVIMAIVTTMMASPLLPLLGYRQKSSQDTGQEIDNIKQEQFRDA